MFIGRESERFHIRRRIDEMIVGTTAANVLFVTGEAGIGKSSLLAAVRSDCERLQPPVIVAAAVCSTPLAGADIGEVEALQPWAEIIAQLSTTERDHNLETRKFVKDLAMAWIHCIPVVGDVLESVADTAQLVSDRRKETPASPVNAASQQQMFQQYINVLDAISQRTSLVLMLDDVHWADASSVNLLFTAARQLQGKPVLFIVAYRPDDAASARGGEGHPILHIRNELERYSLADDVSVPRMTAENMDALLRRRYPTYQNNDAFEEWLARISGGNALFITQFLQTLEEDGHIERAAGIINPGYEQAVVPTSAYSVVQERIRRLNEETRELLRYASVEGETFTSSILAKISETPQLKLLQRLRLAEETHRVVENLGKQRVYSSETTAYRFIHVLLHHAMYESLAEEERELLHEAIFDVLKDEWEAAEDSRDQIQSIAVRIATHAKVLGRHAFAASALLKGANQLLRQWALAESERMINSALDVLDLTAASDEVSKLRGEALIARARIHRGRGDLNAMLQDSRDARTVVESVDQRLWIAALNCEALALFLLEHTNDATTTAQLALTTAEELEDLMGRFDALYVLARIKAIHAAGPEAVEWGNRSIEAARTLGENTMAEATALNFMGMLMHTLGRNGAAMENYQRSLEIYRSLNHIDGEATVLNNLGNVAMKNADTALAAHYFSDAIELCRHIGDRWTEAYCLNNLGVLAMEAKNYEEAMHRFEAAYAIDHAIGDQRAEASALYNLGYVQEEMNAYEAAADYYARSLALYERLEASDAVVFMYAAMGNLSLRCNDLSSARGWYEKVRSRQSAIQDADTELLVTIGLANVAEAEAAIVDEPERSELLKQAIAYLERSVELARQTDARQIQQVTNELERMRSMLNDVGQTPKRY